MKTNKLIIFDLDGTLLNTIEDITDGLNASLKDNNLPPYEISDVKHFVGSGVNILIERALKKHPNADFEKVKNGYMNYYGAWCKNKTKPYSNTIETLKFLKSQGYKLALLSNKPQRDTDATIAHFFPDLFDKAYGARENIKIKPDPEAVYSIIKEFAIDKENVLYVGDSDIDVKTAMNANIKSIICTYGYRTKEELEQYGVEIFASDMVDLKKKILKHFPLVCD